MKTFAISGSDTNIGKTEVTRALVCQLARAGRRVQVVKPVETGVTAGDPHDAPRGAAGLAEPVTLRTFPEPLAPLEAARRAGAVLDFKALAAEVRALPPVDVRLVEGAGGIAVPLTRQGHDWADFASAISADGVVLVVEERLGMINQARLVAHYAAAKGLAYGIVRNAIAPVDPAVRESHDRFFATSGLACWGRVEPGGTASFDGLVQHFGLA